MNQTHTTLAGDSFLADHIRRNSWSRRNRPRRKLRRFLWVSAGTLSALGIAAIIIITRP